jgi:hypothetical protein
MIFRKRKTGAIPDYRPQAEREKDFKFEEIVASADPVNWREKSPGEWRSFSVRDQDGSGSCVMQSIAKLCEVLYAQKTHTNVPFSAGYYKHRSNFPAEGMWGTDAFEIWRKRGIPLEQLAPSQKLNESQLNTLFVSKEAEDTAHVFKIDNYVQFKPGEDFETIASTIQKTGKGVMVWFRFAYNEWTDIPTIKTSTPNLHHSVVAVDYTLYHGKKYLVIEDSWGNFNSWKGKRLISEDFFKARNTFGAYPISFKLLEGTDKPQFTFTKVLEYGMRNNDVLKLQECLRHDGTFPANTDVTGNYFGVTAKAVYDFQVKHNVAPRSELDALGGKRVGQKTLEKLNQLYS